MSQKEIPFCPGPPDHQGGPFPFQMPIGAVDTHAHVISAASFVPDRSYTSPEATEEQYIRMLDEVGMTYGVLIQVSVNGQDNEPMLKALRNHPQRLRGVAVPLLGQVDSYYQKMRDAGVVGIRMNLMFSGGGLDISKLEECDALARDWGWHIQFLLDANDLPALMPRMQNLKSTLVVDHMGYLKTSVGLDSPGFKALVDLVRERAWVKVSGAYRLTDQAPPYEDVVPYAQVLIDAAPERCVWGSDWPHVANWGVMPSVAQLLESLASYAPDEGLRNRILCANPLKLYFS
ncbi:amidohydrolase family protein [Polynucleobacter sp. MG-28-Ekke-A2]|uniref:amidohydrolase family protein n=1 Tax=Polynucleobacter sp. MG-28-Ekke-A2 TaxID=3108276 RepID=UPI002B22FA66|nr:amidohydrolase family protein [Polynucleobacter sp. MG-28-Ekke-A2]MEA9601347.1 amidohydrolase family protein [Polynucleobacter sp. MG-28-Ekke-A2]